MSSVINAIREHVERFWPDQSHEEFSWELGPIEDQVPGFRVRRVAPLGPSEPWVYLTIGASSVAEGGAKEFFLLAPSESPRHIETLAMVASFHADSRYTLQLGNTIDIGRPWAEGSAADHLLVSLPYPYGPALEICEISEPTVQILWLVPVTKAEVNFAAANGVEELEQLLDASGIDVASSTRRSLV